MSFFDFLKPQKSFIKADPIVLKDIDPEFYVHVVAGIDNGKLVYFNKQLPEHHFRFNQEYKEHDFQGRLFKLEMTLKGGNRFDVFYAIPTDDPQGLLMSMTPMAYDNFGIAVLKAIAAKYPNLIKLHELINAPTRWAYHLSYRNDRDDWIICNNFGSEGHYIHKDQIQSGTGPDMAKIYYKA